jgi:hypothetical protein
MVGVLALNAAAAEMAVEVTDLICAGGSAAARRAPSTARWSAISVTRVRRP